MRRRAEAGALTARGRVRAGRGALLLVVLAVLGGLVTSGMPRTASADELDDAYAKQQTLEKLIAKQKSSIQSLTLSQNFLSARISNTKPPPAAIDADLVGVKTEIVAMTVEIARSECAVQDLAK